MHVDSLEIERKRQHALDRFAIVDTRAEIAYDDIAKLAQSLCGTPIALLSLVDHERQWFKARIGTLLDWIPREISFCDHTIRKPSSVMVVNDAHIDERFRDNPLVTGEPYARAYAGAPIVTREGNAVGAVCVVDYEPRIFSNIQLEGMKALARQVSFLLELRLFLQDEREHHAARDDLTLRLRDDRDQLERRHEDLKERAHRDALTGLLNRVGMQALRDTPEFMERFERSPYCLALVDIDHFKGINDCFGHATGDIVLRAVADVMRESLRDGDKAGRYGGEEFALLFPETRLDQAQVVCERIRERVEALDLTSNVTISMGLIEGERHKESRLISLARADRALYEAKRRGRNQVFCGDSQSA